MNKIEDSGYNNAIMLGYRIYRVHSKTSFIIGNFRSSKSMLAVRNSSASVSHENTTSESWWYFFVCPDYHCQTIRIIGILKSAIFQVRVVIKK